MEGWTGTEIAALVLKRSLRTVRRLIESGDLESREGQRDYGCHTEISLCSLRYVREKLIAEGHRRMEEIWREELAKKRKKLAAAERKIKRLEAELASAREEVPLGGSGG